MKTIEVEYFDEDHKIRIRRIDIPEKWITDPNINSLLTKKLKHCIKIKSTKEII
jgi:hypothetical protein